MIALAKRPRGRPPTARESIAQHWARRLAEVALANARSPFPLVEYAHDPLRFAREILGVDLWSRQSEIIVALDAARRVAVSSGNKSGKTKLAAIASVWWWATRTDARVSLSAATSKQIRSGVYREIRKLVVEAGTCLDCRRDAEARGAIAPQPCPHSRVLYDDTISMGVLPETGIVADDGREIIGRAARDPEAARGLSSPNVLLVLDEATGIADEIWEGFSTAVAGGGHIFAISNPTRNTGWFFEAFHGPAKTRAEWVTVTIDTRENPNYLTGTEIYPGLATKEWVDAEIEAHGVESRRVAETITGRFLLRDEGRIFSTLAVAEAVSRWRDCEQCSGVGYHGDDACTSCRGTGSRGQAQYPGRLFLGIDPAGPDGQGDETALAVRRGQKVFGLDVYSGQDEEAILALILSTIRTHAQPREVAHVAVDASGPIGAKIHGRIIAHLSEARRNTALRAFDYLPCYLSAKATRLRAGYQTVRDELAGSLEECVRVHGYALPDDEKLSEELGVLTWETASDGTYKLIPKKKIRAILGRSPDRYDAVSLACWTPASAVDRSIQAPAVEHARIRIPAPDPYRSRDLRGRATR